MNTYRGTYDADTGNTSVMVNGAYPLPRRTDLANHSPTGFSWGYNGSGPAQLALALLAHEYGDSFAHCYYQKFKSDVIACLNGDHSWKLTSEDLNKWKEENRQ